MDTTKSIIVAAIVIVIVIFAGLMLSAGNAPETVEQVGDSVQTEPVNVTAYEIPLKVEDFRNFEIAAPEGSNFTLKKNLTETGRGMKYYQNTGKFQDDVMSLTIDKNMTESFITENMELITDNGSLKIYSAKNIGNEYYQAVKTVNDTDIIISGSNLHIIEEMANTTNVKDTKDLIKVVKAPANKTPVKKVIEKTKKNKTKEKTATKTKTKTKTETKQSNVQTTSSEKIRKTTYPLIIGGGMFTTGSKLSDRTYAKIYVGPEHAGETVKIKILYSRDGKALNQGNLVTKVVEGDGYIHIASADAYSKYPDYAIVKVYDWQGNLQNTQEIALETKSGTQFF